MTLGVLAGASLSVAAEEAAPEPHPAAVAQAHGREQLEDLLAPVLHGGGTWRAANHEHVAGDAQTASHWRLEHEWLFENTLMRYRILGEFEDGRMEKYWEGTVYWDPGEQRARVTQVHRVGIVGSGDIRRIAPDTVRVSMIFRHPGGGSEAFRDDMKSTGPTTMESLSQGYDATEWEWVDKRTEHWTLVGIEAPSASGD